MAPEKQNKTIKNRRVKGGGRKQMKKQGKVMPIKSMRKVNVKKETAQVWAGAGDGGGKGKLSREKSKCN